MRSIGIVIAGLAMLCCTGCLAGLLGRTNDVYTQGAALSGQVDKLKGDLTAIADDMRNYQSLDEKQKLALLDRIDSAGDQIKETQVAVATIAEKAPSKLEAGIAIVGGVISALLGIKGGQGLLGLFLGGLRARRQNGGADA